MSGLNRLEASCRSWCLCNAVSRIRNVGAALLFAVSTTASQAGYANAPFDDFDFDSRVKTLAEAAVGECGRRQDGKYEGVCDLVGAEVLGLIFPPEVDPLEQGINEISAQLDTIHQGLEELSTEIATLRAQSRLKLKEVYAVQAALGFQEVAEYLGGNYLNYFLGNPDFEVVETYGVVRDALAAPTERLRVLASNLRGLPIVLQNEIDDGVSSILPEDYYASTIGDYIAIASLHISALQEFERLAGLSSHGLLATRQADVHTAVVEHANFLRLAVAEIKA